MIIIRCYEMVLMKFICSYVLLDIYVFLIDFKFKVFYYNSFFVKFCGRKKYYFKMMLLMNMMMMMMKKIGEVVILVVVNYDENDNDDFKFLMIEKKINKSLL